MIDSNSNHKKNIEASELILNADGSVFHLKLLPHQIADDIILVGDPQRVSMISDKFDNIEVKIENREFITHTGYFNNRRITALSTGIGTDNIDIVLNELDALANIDLNNRTVKENHKSLNLIRIGTTGSLQKHLPVDSFVLSEYGLGFDGLMHYYDYQHDIEEKIILDSFLEHCHWQGKYAEPYLVKASALLSEKLGKNITRGITATAGGFYGPQGRMLRLKLALPSLNDQLGSFEFQKLQITNFEMETSALFGLSKMLGHNACTICTIIANRIAKQYSKDYKVSVDNLINLVLERLTV